MRHISKLLIVLLGFILLSCSTPTNDQDTTPASTNSGDEVAQTNDETEMGVENLSPYDDVMSFNEISSAIGDVFKTNDQFLSCVAASVDSCINEVTVGNGEAPNCSDFILDENKTACEENILILQARESKDITVCNELETNAENCIYEVTLSIGLSNFDTSMCENVAEGYTVLCNNEIVMAEARQELDANICDDIISYGEGDNFEIEFCKQEVGFMVEENKRLEEQKAFAEQMQNQAELDTQAELEAESQVSAGSGDLSN